MPIAKLFTNGRSQAVRLPKAFRFEGVREVQIERDGDTLILCPVPRPSIARLVEALGQFEHFPDREQPADDDQREHW